MPPGDPGQARADQREHDRPALEVVQAAEGGLDARAEQVTRDAHDQGPERGPREVEQRISPRLESAHADGHGGDDTHAVNETKPEGHQHRAAPDPFEHAFDAIAPLGMAAQHGTPAMTPDVIPELVAEDAAGDGDQEHRERIQQPLVGKEGGGDDDRLAFEYRTDEDDRIAPCADEGLETHAAVRRTRSGRRRDGRGHVPRPYTDIRPLPLNTPREVTTMSVPMLIVVAILVLAGVLLAGYLLRLFRRSRELEKHIDYSRMKEWKDDDW